jgi:hypothetical protein
LLEPRAVAAWNQIFQSTYEGEINSWGYRWVLACWLQGGLSIHPQCNLVSNIGFGSESTHTTDGQSPFAYIRTQSVEFPLRHPCFKVPYGKADRYIQRLAFQMSRSQEIKSKLKSFLKLTFSFGGMKTAKKPTLIS